ncbi:MAG: hypothetical protein WCS27_04175 [Victivallaceae bacterium]
MRKYKLFLLVLSVTFVPSAWATYAVHDSVTYIHDTVKAIQDELYQQMDIDYQIDQLSKTGEILKTGIDTLKVAKDTYSTCKDMYDTAVNISDYIGDPQKLIAYMNSEFWHEDEISAALNITREALDMADSKVANTGNIEYMLRQVDYTLADAEVQRSENLAETQKGALAVHKFMSEWGPKSLLQLQELNREDQKFNGRDSNLTELQYATYKNGIWQSNTLGQLLAVQTMHSAMVARQMYSDNLRLDEADLKRAKSIYDARNINESGVSALESQGSICNNFIDDFINR